MMGTSLGRAAKCPLTHAKLEAHRKRKRPDRISPEPILPTEIWVALLGLSPRVLLDERLLEPDPHPIPSHPPLPLIPIMFNDDIYPPAKDYVSQPLYVRQPCSLQIIQLVECSPPPPQQKYSPSRLSSSSYSDSDSDSDASAYDSSSSSLSAGSSYCSSAEDSAPPVPPSFDNRDPSVDDTYHTRQRRVSLWRDAVYSKDIPNPSSIPNTSGSSPFLLAWGGVGC